MFYSNDTPIQEMHNNNQYIQALSKTYPYLIKDSSIWIYYVITNTIIVLGASMIELFKLEVPELFIAMIAVSYITLHLVVVVNTLHIIIEAFIASIFFCYVFQNYFETIHICYIATGIIMAFIIAIQYYRYIQQEVTKKLNMSYLNQHLYEKRQEILIQNKKIIEVEHTLKHILNSSNMTIWLLDKNYILTEFNDSFKQYMVTTYQIHVERGENFLDKIINFQKRVLWKERFDRAFKGERQKYVDFCLENNKYAEFEVLPIFVDNELVSISIYGKNITEQRKTELTILQNGQLLKSINRNIRDGIYRSTFDKIIYANKACLKLFGYDESVDISQINPSKFYKNEEARNKILNKVLRMGVIDNEEIILYKLDGTPFWALVSLMLQKDEQGNIYFDGVIKDITQKKQIKEQLILQKEKLELKTELLKHQTELLFSKNQELEKTNQELDRFVYSASHDLRAPLTSILGLINVIKLENDPTATFNYLELIEHSVTKLNHFIADIIDFSRNSRMEISPQEIVFSKMINEVFGDLYYLEQSSKIEKVINIEQNITFFSDNRRLLIILNNLLANAINYHNIKQEKPLIEVSVAVHVDYANITIKDNGIGIEQKHLSKIFDMFYRASYDSKGSGLGLYIVKEAIIKLGGDISVQSKIGEGTTFVINLPNLSSSLKESKYILENKIID